MNEKKLFELSLLTLPTRDKILMYQGINADDALNTGVVIVVDEDIYELIRKHITTELDKLQPDFL